MITFKKNHRASYTIEINNRSDLFNLIEYLENLETKEPIEMLYNEKTYKLLLNITEISNDIEFNNQKREITFDLDKEDLETWIYRLQVSLVEKEFNPAELLGFDLKGKPIYTYMTITFDET